MNDPFSLFFGFASEAYFLLQTGSKAGENSATKSARTFDSLAMAVQKITSYSSSSTAHFASRSETSSLWRTNIIGKEVTTTIG